MIKPLAAIFLFMGLTGTTLAADAPDPEAWFKTDYAPLYEHEPWNRTEELLSHYETTIYNHHPAGGVVPFESKEFLPGLLDEWQLDGWTHSQLRDLRMERVNPANVVIWAQWVDFYDEAPVELDCGWYVATLRTGKWRISNYAETDCKEAGF